MKTIIAAVLIIFSFIYAVSSQNDVKTVNGTVTDNVRPCGVFKSDDGKEYKLHLGPVWYWEQNGYELKLNASTQIKGDMNETDIYPYEITQDGKTMKFTDDKGNPLWSNGNGWGNGNGPGNGKCWRNK